MLNISVEKTCGVVTFKCTGRIVRGDEGAILCAAIHQQERELNLELTGVTAIDAGGMGALLSLQAAGLYLRLVNPSAAVRELLRLTKLDTVFEILEPKREAETRSGDEFRTDPYLDLSRAVLQES